VGFQILGAEAWEATPKLIEIYQENLSETSQVAAFLAIMATEPTGRSVLPLLVQAARNPNQKVRFVAVDTLLKLHCEPRLAVPPLAAALSDTNTAIRLLAIRGLGNFGSQAREAVPLLLPMLANENMGVRHGTTAALEAIDPATTAKAGLK